MLVGLLGIHQFPGGPFGAARNWLFDAYQRTWPAERNGSQTAVVEIDEESIRRFGQWPWRRDKLAMLISAAHEARAIGIDILLADADRLAPENLIAELPPEAAQLRASLLILPNPDVVLASAMQGLPVVLAMTVGNGQPVSSPDVLITSPVRQRGNSAIPVWPSANSAILPLPILARAARGMGVISASRGQLGQIIELPAVVETNGSILPGFALELLAVAQDASPIFLNTMPAGVVSVSIGPLVIPTDPSSGIRPRFIEAKRLFRVSAHRLMDPAADLRSLRNRIAIIGVSAAGVAETFQTPVGRGQSGAEIQAQLIESIIAGDTLYRPFWANGLEATTALVLGLVAASLLGRIPYAVYVSALCTVVLLLAGGSVASFCTMGLLLDSLFPITCLVAATLVVVSFRLRCELASRRRREAEAAIERVQREADKRESGLRSEADMLRQSLGFAVDAAHLGMWDADLRNGTWVRSKRHDLILGLSESPPSWNQAMLLERVVPEDLAVVRKSIAIAEETGTLELECRIAWTGEDPHHIHILGRFWRDADGTVSRTAGVVADITQQRSLENRLRQSEKMQAIGLLAAGVAHNFNNLLTVVIGSLELARRKVDSSSSASALICSAIAASSKCAEIARHLLAFGRLQTLRPVQADTADLLRNVYQMLRDALPLWVQVSLTTSPQLPGIKIDQREFELALLNLAMNAKDAMPSGGQITINAFVQENNNSSPNLTNQYLVVEVIDNGSGIPPEQLPKVFEPFFTTKEIGRGTGLGLSQVYGFAHQSGGGVEIESTVGQGTHVRLYLPIHEL